MHRRDFAKSAFIGAATAALPAAAAARVHRPPAKMSYENVVFTEDDPGHWADWVSLHVPQVSVDGGKLSVRTPHPQSDEHYIVSHAVVLADGRFLGRATFSPNDAPASVHNLPAGYRGAVKVISTCNRHDTWMTTIRV